MALESVFAGPQTAVLILAVKIAVDRNDLLVERHWLIKERAELERCDDRFMPFAVNKLPWATRQTQGNDVEVASDSHLEGIS